VRRKDTCSDGRLRDPFEQDEIVKYRFAAVITKEDAWFVALALSGNLRRFRLSILIEPVEVGFGTGDDGQGDEFGDVVAVQALYFPFQAA
jgi:hypothetical protein